jgi:hypothetical protein
MNTEDRNENVLNQMAGSSFSSTLAAAGAAVLGGSALYYYLNNNGPKPFNVIDYKMQTREVEVSWTLHVASGVAPGGIGGLDPTNYF